MVSGTLSLPSRGAFHLSLTVLCAIGHQVVFSLGGWSPRLPTGFLVSCGTLDTRPLPLPFAYGAVTLCGATFQKSLAKEIHFLRVHNPEGPKTLGLGSFHFARRYFGNRCFFLFLRLLRCFSSPGSLCMTMNSSCSDGALPPPGFPIRTSMDQRLLAAPHGFSQLTTSFFGSWCQGIHPMLFLA